MENLPKQVKLSYALDTTNRSLEVVSKAYSIEGDVEQKLIEGERKRLSWSRNSQKKNKLASTAKHETDTLL